MSAYGYAVVEESRPGRFEPAEAKRLGVSFGPDFGRLQRGEAVEAAGGTVTPEQVMGEARRGRKIVITGDTAPCEMTRLAAHEAELLIHDGSFADEEVERAAETGHSTARQAAELAREAGVGMLALVHVSSRYNVSAVLDEAREAFPGAIAPRDFDVVEIPLPERGSPRLIEKGARRRGRPESPAVEPASALAERRGEVGDRVGDGRRLILLQEVLRGQQDRIVDPEDPLRDLQLVEAERRVALAPDDPRRVAALGEPSPEELALRLGQLEGAHDPKEGCGRRRRGAAGGGRRRSRRG